MLAIIPARGGSKGLPGKNIRPLLGKPLLAYTIEAAKNSRLITDIVISTDDEEIAGTAVKFGARLPFMRPANLASDNSLAIETYMYTIEKIARDSRKQIDAFVVLQPTSPLRTSGDIDAAISLFIERKADSVVSYTEEAHPVNWHKYISQDMSFENIFTDRIANRQEYRKSYFPNGAIFVYRYNLIRSGNLYSRNSFAYIMPRDRSVDIDTMQDFDYAEFLLLKQENPK
jgi:CMP-N,N'-diacetyllegionaminic acid synthase